MLNRFKIVDKINSNLVVKLVRETIIPYKNNLHGRFFVLVIVVVLSALLEALGVLAFIPFLTAMVEPSKILVNPDLNEIVKRLRINSDRELVVTVSICFGLMTIFSMLMRLIQLKIITKVSFLLGALINELILSRTLYSSYLSLLERNSSEIISALAIKTNTVVYQVIIPGFTLVSAVIMLLSLGLTVVIIAPTVALLSVTVLSVLYLLIVRLAGKILTQYGNEHSSASEKSVKIAQEAIGGFRDVLLSGSQEHYISAFSRSEMVSKSALGKSQFVSLSPKIIIESFALVSIALIAMFVSGGAQQISVVIPALGALALCVQKILPLIQQIFWCWSTYASGEQSLIDVVNIIVDGKGIAETHGCCCKILDEIKIIEFRGVSFCYPNSIKNAVDGVNLTIRRGERIGIIGQSGCGKSTLIDLLCLLMNPTQGGVYFNNILVSEQVRLDKIQGFGVVPQSIFLSDSSLLENIAYGVQKDQINMQLVKEAILQAQLTKLVESLPDGYFTRLGERGAFLSGGQRQRIGIARALYKKPSILIFDEATSALDEETENSVISALEQLDRGITVVMVAHRKTSLKGCDRIVEMYGGKVLREMVYMDLVSHGN